MWQGQAPRPASAWCHNGNSGGGGGNIRQGSPLTVTFSTAALTTCSPTSSASPSPTKGGRRKLAPWEENLQAASWPDYLERYKGSKELAVHQGGPPPIHTQKDHYLKEMAFHPILQRWLTPQQEACAEAREQKEAARLRNRNKGIRAATQTTRPGEFPFRMAPEPEKRRPYAVPPKLRSDLFDILSDHPRPKVEISHNIRRFANDSLANHNIVNNFPNPGVVFHDGRKPKPTAELRAIAEKAAYRFDPLRGEYLTEQGREYDMATHAAERFQRRQGQPSKRAYNWMTSTGEGGENEVRDLELGTRRKNVDSVMGNVERDRETEAKRDVWRIEHKAEVREAYTEAILAEPRHSMKGGYVKKEEDMPHGYNIVNLRPNATAARLAQGQGSSLPPVSQPLPTQQWIRAPTPQRAWSNQSPMRQEINVKTGGLPPANHAQMLPAELSPSASRDNSRLPTASGLPQMGGIGRQGGKGGRLPAAGDEPWRRGWIREADSTMGANWGQRGASGMDLQGGWKKESGWGEATDVWMSNVSNSWQ